MLLRDHKENSQFYWYPKVLEAGVRLPKTVLVSREWEQEHGLKEPAGEIGFPLFLRSDFTSLKHSWEKSALVTQPEDLQEHASLIAMDSAFQGLPLNGWVLRELLPLETAFTAFRGMPVHKELRYFLKDGEVQCWHPYWPEDAFEGQMIEGWREKLAELNRTDCDDHDRLAINVFKTAGAVPGYWSADFAKCKDGSWYLLDMAMGEDSFHLKGCKFANHT